MPLGGSMGGVVCNPKELSSGELERLSRGYVRALGPALGSLTDVPEPDVYTTPQVMAWMMDEYATLAGHNVSGVITSKPLPLGAFSGVYFDDRGRLLAMDGVSKIISVREVNWQAKEVIGN